MGNGALVKCGSLLHTSWQPLNWQLPTNAHAFWRQQRAPIKVMLGSIRLFWGGVRQGGSPQCRFSWCKNKKWKMPGLQMTCAISWYRTHILHKCQKWFHWTCIICIEHVLYQRTDAIPSDVWSMINKNILFSFNVGQPSCLPRIEATNSFPHHNWSTTATSIWWEKELWICANSNI